MKRRVSLLAVLLLSLTLVTNSISIFATSESDPVSPTPTENENGNSVDDETNNDNSDENNENPDNEETSGVVIPDDNSLLGNPPRPSETVSGNDNDSTFSLMSVSGGDLSTWAGYGFEDASNPPDDAVFFFKGSAVAGSDPSLGDVGYVSTFYTNADDGYKILGYDGSSIITSTEHGYVKIASPSEKDLDTVLAEYRYIKSSDGEIVCDAQYMPHLGNLYTPYSDNCCFLIFSKDASSISDLLYKVSFSDVLSGKYSANDCPESLSDAVPVGEPTITINLVEKLSIDGKRITGGKYKVNYALPQVKLTSGSIIDDEAVHYEIQEHGNYTRNISGSSGEFEFEFNVLENKTYTLIIKTNSFQEYTTTFVVDYVEALPDTNPDADNLSTPEITFSPFPDGEHFDGESIKMTMFTNNVKTIMSFNGVALANEAYTNSAEFTISENGVYHCIAVSAAGKVAETDLVVDFFKPVEKKPITDTTDEELVNGDDDKLSQTGFGYNVVLYIFAILLICSGAFLLLNKKYNFLNMEVIKNVFNRK